MAVNKVVCTGLGTILDLQADTVTSDMMFSGYTAHAASGEVVTGSLDIADMTWNDLLLSKYNQEVPSISLGTQEIVPNKVMLGNRVLVDLTTDTANAYAVIAGVMFHGTDGHITNGCVQLSNLTWNDYEDILTNS